ncbi:MAG: response regulator, partial [Sinobacterium sp.]|nr:response regulator [Sinobacterium sp.]
MKANSNTRQLILISGSAVFAVLVICLSFYINHAKVSNTEKILTHQQLQLNKINFFLSLHEQVISTNYSLREEPLKQLLSEMGKETKPWIKELFPLDEWKVSYRDAQKSAEGTRNVNDLQQSILRNTQHLKNIQTELLASVRQQTVNLKLQLDDLFVLFTASMFLIIFDACLFIYFYSRQVLRSQNEYREHTLALEDEHARLEASTKEKSNLLRMLNQEVRTPLHQISGIADMLDQGLRRQTQEGSKHNDGSIDFERVILLKSSVDELLLVLNNVVSYTEIDSGASEIEMDTVDVKVFCTDIYRHIKPLATANNLKFSLSASSKLPNFLHLDKARVDQVLVHLLKNAIKYTAKGGAKLQVSLGDDIDASKLSKDLQSKLAHKSYVVFTISDTGCGLASKDRDLINSALPDIHSGHNQFATSCLGMAITQKLLCFMHGFMFINSELGKGSTVYVFLPLNKVSYIETQEDENIGEALGSEVANELASQHVQNGSQNLSDAEETGKSLKILIAEDIDSNADLLTWMLEDLGHQAVVTTNGEECIEALKRENFDVIFMDQFMPVMDGQSATIK